MKRIPVLIATIAMAVSLAACGVNPTKAKRAIEAQGMTDPVILGYNWFGCAETDQFHSNFRAVGANGTTVEGVVCSGFLKGTTVRTY